MMRHLVAGAAGVAYCYLVWSLNLPEEVWAVALSLAAIGLVAGAWWPLALAVVVPVYVLADGTNDADIPDSALIFVYGVVGVLSVTAGVAVAKLPALLWSRRSARRDF